jgi:hypothetical protein
MQVRILDRQGLVQASGLVARCEELATKMEATVREAPSKPNDNRPREGR